MLVSDAMKFKIEILKLMGASDTLIRLYCPIVPESLEHEEITYFWLDEFQKQVRMCLNDERDSVSIDYKIQEGLLDTHITCPYCKANRNYSELGYNCEKCSYGKTYGKCGDDNSLWNMAKRYAEEGRYNKFEGWPTNIKWKINRLFEEVL